MHSSPALQEALLNFEEIVVEQRLPSSPTREWGVVLIQTKVKIINEKITREPIKSGKSALEGKFSLIRLF